MEQKIAVVFHSVCGNTYQMADQYRQAFEDLGAKVAFYRLKGRVLVSKRLPFVK